MITKHTHCECDHCGHVWFVKQRGEIPVVCPGCKTTDWGSIIKECKNDRDSF